MYAPVQFRQQALSEIVRVRGKPGKRVRLVLGTSKDPGHPHETHDTTRHNYREEDYDDVLEQIEV